MNEFWFGTGYDPTAAEVAAQATFFEGTTTPRLTLEHDSPWISVFLPPEAPVTQALLAKLNDATEATQGGAFAANVIRKHTSMGHMHARRITMADVALRGRYMFYRALGCETEPDKPQNIIEVATVQRIKPLNIIEMSRLLYDNVGDNFADINTGPGRFLYSKNYVRIQRRIQRIRDAGIDVRGALLGTQLTIAAQLEREDDPKLLELAERSAATYKKRLAAAEHTGAVVLPKITDPAERIGVGLRRPHRYEQLAELTGLDTVLLQAGLPVLDVMGPEEYERAMQEIDWAVKDLQDIDLDRKLRLRDLMKYIPQQPQKGSTGEANR